MNNVSLSSGRGKWGVLRQCLFRHFPSRFVFPVLVISVFLVSCASDEDLPDAPVRIPSWFPELPVPADNELTAARVTLGRRLFHEPLLSRDSSISCASCHLQHIAFTDGVAVSIGVEGRAGARNAPTLANVAYVPALNADGGIPNLELQAQAPIFAHEEMDFTIAGFIARISADASYTAQFQAAYGRAPDAFGISRALAAFQRTIISAGSAFDSYEYQGKSDALTAAELRGRDLFMGARAGCSDCHTPPLFTDAIFTTWGFI
jgi:cytochrome c peroxidase